MSDPDHTKHDMSVDRTGKHISDGKVYLMPESYNALRRELHDNWHNLWNLVQGPMAFDGPRFVDLMNEALGLMTQFDSDNVSGICARYLDTLRKLRGLSPLHTPSEYHIVQQVEDSIKQAREENEVAPWLRPPA